MIGNSLLWTMISLGLLFVIRPQVADKLWSRATAWTSYLNSRIKSSVLRKHESNLQICEVSADEMTIRKAMYSFGSGLGGIAMVAIVGNSFQASSGILVVALVMAMLGLGFIYPDLVLQKEAGRRRKSFRYGFSSFLDLVTVLLAGGSGIESALLMASETGDGQTFEQIRKSLRRSQVARTSPWDELADLGRRFGIDEIVEVAGSVELAGRHGARIRDTLVARAATLRHRQLSDIEAEAAAATERMGMPMVLLFIGFISLVGYPAVVEMLQGW